MTSKRKGFIVIEIVIISVIIFAMGAVMFFMNKDAASSAQASIIIRNFRSLKAAAVAWRNDNNTSRHGTHNRQEILKYLKSHTPLKLAEDSAEQGSYMLRLTDDGKTLYIGYELTNNKSIKHKLTAKAESAKLLGSDMKTLYNNDPQVWMQVISSEG